MDEFERVLVFAWLVMYSTAALILMLEGWPVLGAVVMVMVGVEAWVLSSVFREDECQCERCRRERGEM